MAVNGIEIEVGQEWRTAGGHRVRVTARSGADVTSPWFLNAGYWVTDEGAAAGDPTGLNHLSELLEDLDAPEPSALAIQVGGTHYKDFAIQPVEYIHANKLGFCEGNVVKYITRHAAKNGADDIRKVIHYCQLLLELQYGVKKEGESK